MAPGPAVREHPKPAPAPDPEPAHTGVEAESGGAVAAGFPVFLVQRATAAARPPLPPPPDIRVQRMCAACAAGRPCTGGGCDHDDDAPATPVVQARLVIGAADDPFEREADRVADAVVRGARAAPSTASAADAPLRLKSLPDAAAPRAAPAALPTAGPGSPLPTFVRRGIETALGVELGHVRVHGDPAARGVAASLRARAFTHGSHIWLGPGEREDDTALMAHEATHVVQQAAGAGGTPLVQRAAAADDGAAVASRIQAAIDEELEEGAEDADPADAEAAAAPADRSALAAHRSELEPQAEPPDRAGEQQPTVEAAAQATQEEADTPGEPVVSAVEGGGGESGTEDAGAADAAADAAGAAASADLAFQASGGAPPPPPVATVLPPAPVAPVDAAGLELPGDSMADDAVAGLAIQAQVLREEGQRLRELATEERANAAVLRGNLELVRTGVGQAAEGVSAVEGHQAFRSELVGQAEQALAVSEEKAAAVAAGAPSFSGMADTGKAETGPMAGEASDLTARNAANTPRDPEAAANAREQGGKFTRASSDIATTDDAVTQTQTRTASLAEEAAEAASTNTETRGRVDGLQATLASTDERLGEMGEQNATASGEVDGLMAQPDEMAAQADSLDERGAALIAASLEMEARLHETQRSYGEGMRAVPASQPARPEPEAPSAPVAPSTPSAPAPAAAVDGGDDPATAAGPPPGMEDQVEDFDALAAAVDGAGGIEAVLAAQAEPEAESAAGGGGGVGEPMAIPSGYAARERVDAVGAVTGALPAWLTGVDPATEEQRQAAAIQAEERRQAQIQDIEAMAGGRFEDLSAADRAGIALRLTGRNLFGSVSNIQWPGWGALATGMIDPRGPLMGVVSGLGMMLSGGANLLSGEQWQRDPLGNLLKSAADIATGLTIILGSITALAGVIIAIMAAITIFSFGTAAPVTGPVIAFCATVMTTVGGWTIAVGKVALLLQALVFIKNLIDAACARTASELQGTADQMTEDASSAGNVVLQIGMAKLAQVGGRATTSRIADAGGGRAFAAGMPGRFAAGVRGLPGRLSAGAAATGRGLAATGRGIAAGARATSAALRRAPGWIRDRLLAGRNRRLGLLGDRPIGGGHRLKVTRGGMIVRCTTCGDLRALYDDVLTANPGYRARLADIQRRLRRKAGRSQAMDDLVALEREMATARYAPAPNTGGALVEGQVGTYDALTRAGLKADGLTPDHLPSRAALVEAAEARLGRSLTAAEKRLINQEGVTVSTPTRVHVEGSATYGGRNTAGRILVDAGDLGRAFGKDAEAILAHLHGRGQLTPNVVGSYLAAYQQNVARGIFAYSASVDRMFSRFLALAHGP